MVTLDNVTLLMGYNPRGQCYAQAMRHAGFAPASVITFGDQARDLPRRVACPPLTHSAFSFSPDLDEPLSETIRGEKWSWAQSDAEHINDPAILALVRAQNSQIVVYAGYGGQIVGEGLLAAIPAFLHMHCGLLPEYRGSTTVYFSWLRENACGVSAILMDAEIDTGPVILKKAFPPPPSGADVDLFYDNTMRAHVLIDCMKAVAETGSLPPPHAQPEGGGIYYVIHPVLKHIALMQPRDGA